MHKALLLSTLGCVTLACSGDSAGIASVDSAFTEVGTVLRVSWTLDAQGESWVSFGPEEDCERFQTHRTPGETGEVLLVGLPTVTDSCFTFHAEIDGTAHTWPTEFFRTGNAPAVFEDPDVESLQPEAFEDGFLLGNNPLSNNTLYMLNREGQFVWWHQGPEGYGNARMILASDKQSVFYNEFNIDFSIDSSRVVEVGLDGVEKNSTFTPNGHHGFEILEDGTLAYLAIDVREVEGLGTVVGDTLMLDDGSGPVALYSTWDDPQLIVEAHDNWDSPFYPQGHDWTHANYVEYSKERDSFLISFTNIHTLVEIDAQSGEHLRSIGHYGTYDIDESLIRRPHTGSWTPEGTILVFTTPEGTEESIALELALDEENQSASTIWSYGEGLERYSHILGEAKRLENGNTLVNFGSKGIVEEVNTEGEVLWRFLTTTGVLPGHVSLLKSFY